MIFYLTSDFCVLALGSVLFGTPWRTLPEVERALAHDDRVRPQHVVGVRLAEIGGDDGLEVAERLDGGALVILGLLQIVRLRGDAAAEGGDTSLRAYVVAAGAPTFFGTSFVIRRWGLNRMPGSVVGAFLGAIAGFRLTLGNTSIASAVGSGTEGGSR